ncbi:MAG: cytochrome c oxidase subunit II [Flavobacteriales bacterium]|nr:cytochrome c oxidase subunit II [Flavobacteriales bacterium]
MTKLLILFVVVMGVLAIAQLARVYELTARLTGKREEDISPADNRMNAMLMWAFCVAYFLFFAWLTWAYWDEMLPLAASEHGVETDWLMNFNWWILLVAFVPTNVLLFYFAGKYKYDKNRKAFWQPHNNTLELIWTVVPAAVLAVIIIYGLNSWQKITTVAGPDALRVELYAKQFDWTARYPGDDGVLGASDFRLINSDNPLGIVTPESVAKRMGELDVEIAEIDSTLAHGILPAEKRHELEKSLELKQRIQARIVNLRTVMDQDLKTMGNESIYNRGADDIVTKDFYLPVHKEVELLIRSRDVLHSAYMPHLRAQMNAVPGMTTSIKMTPTITSDSMRTHVMKDDQFEFILLCNKICGASHYNMQMPLMVTEAGEYDAWLKEAKKKPFQGGVEEVTIPEASADTTQVIVPVAAPVVAAAH